MELSVAYALVISLTIMANLTGSVLVLKESFTPNKIAACVLVAAGLVVMSR
jgi:multidrug transporter EmrE-like cation transporter